jgi:transketolase
MASLSQAPMICFFSHTGFQDAADGASHQALSYLAMVSSIPHVKVYCLACAEEAEALVLQAFREFAKARNAGKVPDTSVFFLGRENFPKTYGYKGNYDLETPQVYGEGTDGLVASTGSTVWQALMAQQLLAEKGKKVSVIHFPRVNPPNVSAVLSNFKANKGPLVFVEDHQKMMGFGQILTASLVQADVQVKPKHLAVNGEFGQSAYNAVELYEKHGIDAYSIVKQF